MHNLDLIQNIKKKNITIGIVGIGYVGLKLLIQFANAKFRLIGFDNDIKKIGLLKKSKSPISYISDREINKIRNKTSYENKLLKIKDCNVIIICLPTPLKNKKPDLSHIKKAMFQMKDYLVQNQIMILESTTYPGTTEEIIKPFLDKKFNVGKDYFLGYSPERENPGDKSFKFNEIPKICSGYSVKCLKICTSIYQTVVKKVIQAKSLQEAELSKLLENIYRSVNIGLVNELKMITHNMKIDFKNVLSLADTKPFGFKRFEPGPGVGGHCIPIDPYYMAWKANQFNEDAKFIKLAGDINEKTSKWICNNIIKIIKSNKYKFEQTRILLLGLAYKKNIEDTRESASIKIFSLLRKKKIKVNFSDPFVKEFKLYLKKKLYKYKSININKKNIKKFDIVILLSDHDKFEYSIIKKYSKILIDTRGRIKRNKNFYSL